MRSMFEEAETFDQSLDSFDMSSVTRMERMFYGAESFAQSVSLCLHPNRSDHAGMFNGTKCVSQLQESAPDSKFGTCVIRTDAKPDGVACPSPPTLPPPPMFPPAKVLCDTLTFQFVPPEGRVYGSRKAKRAARKAERKRQKAEHRKLKRTYCRIARRHKSG